MDSDFCECGECSLNEVDDDLLDTEGFWEHQKTLEFMSVKLFNSKEEIMDILALQNTKQVVKLPVSAVIASQTPDVIKDEMQMIYANYTGEERDAKLSEVADKLPPKMKEELSYFGCKLPTDVVNFYMSLGSYFFDMYVNNLPKKESPIQKQLLEVRKGKLAELLLEDEFTLPAWAEEQISKNMSDEENYGKLIFTLLFDVNGLEKSCQVNSRAISLFSVIEQAAASYFVGKIPME
jgi:hypothetical protein